MIGKICLISRCLFRFRLPLLKEIFVRLLCKTPAILMMGMGIKACYHPCLGVPGVALNGLDVAAADLQLQRGAAMAQAVEYYWTQIMLSDKLSQQSGNFRTSEVVKTACFHSGKVKMTWERPRWARAFRLSF